MRIVLVPGHRTWAEHPRMRALSQRLRMERFSVVVFDPTWPLDSEGNYQVVGVSRHMQKLSEMVSAEDIVVGHSQAGGYVARLAAEGKIKAGVSLFGVTEVRKRPEMFRQKFGLVPFVDQDGIRWVYTEEFLSEYSTWDVLSDFSSSKVPLLFLAGTRDERVLVSEVKAGYDAANSPKEFVEIVGGHLWERDHGCLDQIVIAIRDWVNNLA